MHSPVKIQKPRKEVHAANSSAKVCRSHYQELTLRRDASLEFQSAEVVWNIGPAPGYVNANFLSAASEGDIQLFLRETKGQVRGHHNLLC